MASYKRFEDLPVWQAAIELYERISAFLQERPPGISYSFRDQLERAALSVSNNIAEGFERGTTAEMLAFIYIARGSAGEVRSMLRLLGRRASLKSSRPCIEPMIASAESCSRQLQGWAQSLQDSDIRGQRHHNQQTREEESAKKRVEQFQREGMKLLASDHPLRMEYERKHGKLPE
jgi:four helix bundle protein